MNNYRFLEMRVDYLGRKKMTQEKLAKELKIERNRIQQLETSPKVIPKEEELRAYCEYFNTTSDYLLRIRDTKPIDENIAMISQTTGLSGKSIEVLKSWNKLKKNPKRYAVSYGVTDINTLNLLLEDYYALQYNANKKGQDAGFSIFHFIGNYIFSEQFRKYPTNTVKYEHKSTNPEIGNPLSILKVGDTVNVNEEERIILNLYTFDERNHDADSDKMAYYNIENTDESYNISFQDMLKAYTKENIIKIIDRVKKRIQGSDVNETT